jgi:hypothetical protein
MTIWLVSFINSKSILDLSLIKEKLKCPEISSLIYGRCLTKVFAKLIATLKIHMALP